MVYWRWFCSPRNGQTNATKISAQKIRKGFHSSVQWSRAHGFKCSNGNIFREIHPRFCLNLSYFIFIFLGQSSRLFCLVAWCIITFFVGIVRSWTSSRNLSITLIRLGFARILNIFNFYCQLLNFILLIYIFNSYNITHYLKHWSRWTLYQYMCVVIITGT